MLGKSGQGRVRVIPTRTDIELFPPCQVVLKNTFCFNFRGQDTFVLYQEKEVTAIFPLLPY